MSEWIKCCDRLPEFSEVVLVSDGIRVTTGEYDKFWCAIWSAVGYKMKPTEVIEKISYK